VTQGGARVVVTGIGVVSSIGADRESFESALRAGICGIGPMRVFDTSGHRAAVAGEVTGLRPESRIPASWLAETSRTDAFGLVAAAEAMAHAGARAGKGIGIVVGGTTGGMPDAELDLAALHRDRSASVAQDRIRSHPISATADRIAAAIGLTGPRATICTACSSGANALGVAARMIRQGRARAVLAGGTDALCRLTYGGFGALGALDPQPCRPFDRTRRGLSLGEGAAMLLLENMGSALARGANVLAELRGWATTAEAHHVTNPMESGAAAAETMRQALQDAGVAPDDVDYVNAHGTGTTLNDPMEARAMRTVFGERSRTLPCSSTKGAIGHTLGAAGAIEAAATVLAIRGGFVPPTVGLSDPDPACPLGHVTGTAQAASIRFAVSSSFGFGGNDAVLVFGKSGAQPPPPVRAAPRPVFVTGIGEVRGTEELRAELDPGRARRFDRRSRMATLAASRALGAGPPRPRPIGIVLGSAWGAFDRSAAFVDRMLSKGARFAEPAEFPNLLASAPAGHASIYLGLTGPNLTVAALEASGALAVAIAADEVAAGAADAILAGSAEEQSEILATLSQRAGGSLRPPLQPPEDGAVVVLLESAREGRTVLARVVATAIGAAAAADALRGWEGSAVERMEGPSAILEAVQRVASAGLPVLAVARASGIEVACLFAPA